MSERSARDWRRPGAAASGGTCGRCGHERLVLDSPWVAPPLCADCLRDVIAELQVELDAMRRPVPVLPLFLRSPRGRTK